MHAIFLSNTKTLYCLKMYKQGGHNVSNDYVWHYGPVWIDIQDTQRPRAAAAVFSGQLNHKQGGS